MFYSLIDTEFIQSTFQDILNEIKTHYHSLVTINSYGIGFKNKQKALMRPYIEDFCPHILKLYNNPQLIKKLGSIVPSEKKLIICDSSMVRSCEVIVSDSEDNHIDWHKDYNLYNSRRFTFLLVLEVSNGQVFFVEDIKLKFVKNLGIIFDDETYHKVGMPTNVGKRITLSFSYTTDPSINLLKYIKRFPQTLLYKIYSLLNYDNYIRRITIPIFLLVLFFLIGIFFIQSLHKRISQLI